MANKSVKKRNELFKCDFRKIGFLGGNIYILISHHKMNGRCVKIILPSIIKKKREKMQVNTYLIPELEEFLNHKTMWGITKNKTERLYTTQRFSMSSLKRAKQTINWKNMSDIHDRQKVNILSI